MAVLLKPDEFTAAMTKIARYGEDLEGAHGMADGLLCEVLRKLGYEEGVKVFEDMTKWYA